MLSSVYFFTYNFVNLVLWSYMLSMVASHLATKFYFSLAFNTIDYLRIVQTIAILEPFHALLLGTSFFNTFMQVASRLLIVWGPHYYYSSELIRMHWSFAVLTSAWSIAEIIRYSFYCLKDFGVPYSLKWLRYSGFIVLYPIGVSMEIVSLYLVTLENEETKIPIYSIIALYVPGLYVLYSYMLKQRKKVLFPKATIKPVKNE
eukprot:NODE_75_length_23955_cov_0.435069.p15 type:complete len:203 gc:universal NODE_75_length_23955_cov_0.435069:21670-21062(-)